MPKSSKERTRRWRQNQAEGVRYVNWPIHDELVDDLVRKRWLPEGRRDDKRLIMWALSHCKVAVPLKPDDLEIPEDLSR